MLYHSNSFLPTETWVFVFTKYTDDSIIMASTTINASCLCKSVHFTVTGQPKGAVLCHCSNCKSFHGSAFAHNYRMMKTQVDFQNGKDLLRSYKDDATKSGKVLERFFCSKCVRYPYLVCCWIVSLDWWPRVENLKC